MTRGSPNPTKPDADLERYVYAIVACLDDKRLSPRQRRAMEAIGHEFMALSNRLQRGEHVSREELTAVIHGAVTLLDTLPRRLRARIALVH